MAGNTAPSTVCKYSSIWGFCNPFESWEEPGLKKLWNWKLYHTDKTNLPADREELNQTLPVQKPSFHSNSADDDGVRVTWIGHATTLIQLDGISILTDPIFSDTAGPTVYGVSGGDKRYRPPACKVGELPEVDAVIISHSHFDHLDAQSVYDLHERFKDRLRWFVPKNLKAWFKACGCQNVCEMDWWQEEMLPGRSDEEKVKFVFTPAQHWSGRNLVFDKNKSLWGSWCVIGPRHKFYFAGDTGYDGEVFKEIGRKYGPFDLAAIPIGAYLPREIMKPQHVDPAEAVLIHEDVQAKKSVGIHWGTFALAYEPYLQPPKDLKKALQEKGMSEKDFFVLQHGESKTVGKGEEQQSQL